MISPSKENRSRTALAVALFPITDYRLPITGFSTPQLHA
jgi:hypothetical protein